MSSYQFVQEQMAGSRQRGARFRWALLYIGPVILCAAVALLASMSMPKIYAARAEIIFQPLQPGDISQAYKATQSVIISGQTVLGMTAQTFGRPIADLAAAFSVSFPKSGSVMQLQYADADPAVAINTLNLILDRYLLMLGNLDAADQATHGLLVPPFLLDDPIQPQPIQALVIGLIVGLAIALAALALMRRSRETR